MSALMTDEERDRMLANRPERTVTKDHIEGLVVDRHFHVPLGTTLTICVLTLKNGFQVVGESACAHGRNFDAELGMKIAYDNAINKIWPLEGYLLREILYQEVHKQ